MRKTIALILLAVACSMSACSASTAGQSSPRPYYISKPARQFASDTTADGVLVYYDVAAVTWLNAMLLDHRREMQEGGVCLHVASRQPPDGFKVDSLARAERFPGDTTVPTWRQVLFHCRENGEWAPLHFHVIVPELAPAFQAVGNDLGYLDGQCMLSQQDRAPYWSRYPFNAMMCGFGTDSIIVYRVRKR